VSKSARNQEDTSIRVDDIMPTDIPSEVPTDDRSGTKKVHSNNKPDNKLSNKPDVDSDLAEIVEAWPELPEAIRSAIVAIVRASAGKHTRQLPLKEGWRK